MNMYERIEFLRKKEGISQGNLEKELEMSNGSISKWKTSTPKPERLQKIADHFGVTIDFLMGRTDDVVCPICKHAYLPFNDFDVAIHDMYHEKFIHAKEVFPFFIEERLEARKIKNGEQEKFMNSSLVDEERLIALNKFLEANFSSNIGYLDLNIDMNTYADFCKTEIIKLLKEESVQEELVDKICKLYDIDKTYLEETDIIFAKASKNPQFIRILKYAEKLNPEMLNALEIQIKALAEQNDKE